MSPAIRPSIHAVIHQDGRNVATVVDVAERGQSGRARIIVYLPIGLVRGDVRAIVVEFEDAARCSLIDALEGPRTSGPGDTQRDVRVESK